MDTRLLELELMNMGNLATLIICIVLIIVLIAVLIFMLKTLFSFLAMHIRATKTFVTQPGAEEAYNLLKRKAVNGRVSSDTLEEAITIMASKGVSADEIYNFLADCNMLIEMDAQKTRNFIRRTEEKIRTLANAEAYLHSTLKPSDAVQASMYIDDKRTKLNEDITEAQKHLKL